MDPEERQKQREARRRARTEKTEVPEENNHDVFNGPKTLDNQEYEGQVAEEQESRERQENEEKERERRIREEKEENIRKERERQEAERIKEMKAEEENAKELENQRLKEEARLKKEAQEKEALEKKKPEKKRKGLGGLSPEKKRMLKQLIMQKAAEEMKAEAKKRQEEKENYLKTVVPNLELDTSSAEEITKIVKKYYEKLCALESDKYDWEIKLQNLDFEINELTLKVNNAKGKFVKPVLKRVSKTEGKWSKLEKQRGQNQISFRDQLKSTGQNKFALEEKDETHKNPDWREHLKSKDMENSDEAMEDNQIES